MPTAIDRAREFTENDKQAAIVAALFNSKTTPLMVKEICACTSLARRTAGYHLDQLTKNSLVLRIEGPRTGERKRPADLYDLTHYGRSKFTEPPNACSIPVGGFIITEEERDRRKTACSML